MVTVAAIWKANDGRPTPSLMFHVKHRIVLRTILDGFQEPGRGQYWKCVCGQAALKGIGGMALPASSGLNGQVPLVAGMAVMGVFSWERFNQRTATYANERR
jgi:hypothetical protein